MKSSLWYELTVEFAFQRNKVFYYISKIPVIRKFVKKDSTILGQDAIIGKLFVMIPMIVGMLLSSIASFLVLQFLRSISSLEDRPEVFGTMLCIYGLLTGLTHVATSMIAKRETNIISTLFYEFRLQGKSLYYNSMLLFMIKKIPILLLFYYLAPSLLFYISYVLYYIGGLLISNTLYLYFGDRNKKILNGIVFLVWVLLLLLVVYISTPYVFQISSSILSLVSILLCIGSSYALHKVSENVDFREVVHLDLARTKQIRASISNNSQMKDHYEQKIDHVEIDVTGMERKESGIRAINATFFERHKKLWQKGKTVKIVILSIILIVVVGLQVAYVHISEVRNFVHSIIGDMDMNILFSSSFPTLMFIVYYLNNSGTLIDAIFYNCDYAMLRFPIFRERNNLMHGFYNRLFHIVKISLPQTVLFAMLVSSLLALENAPFSYIIIGVVLTIAFDVFCSFQTLAMYYLLQPYSKTAAMKNYTYMIANLIFYSAIYMTSRITVAFPMFSVVLGSVMILYSFIITFLLYRYGSKRFYLRE